MAVRTENLTPVDFSTNPLFRSVVRDQFGDRRTFFGTGVMEVQTCRIRLRTSITPCVPFSFVDPSTTFAIRSGVVCFPVAIGAQYVTLIDLFTERILPIAESYHSTDGHRFRGCITMVEVEARINVETTS